MAAVRTSLYLQSLENFDHLRGVAMSIIVLNSLPHDQDARRGCRTDVDQLLITEVDVDFL